MNQFFAVSAKGSPKDHIAKNRHVGRKMTGRRFTAGLQESCHECLVANLSLAFKKVILVEDLHSPVRLAGDAQTMVMLIDAFVQTPRHSKSSTVIENASHNFVEIRFQSII